MSRVAVKNTTRNRPQLALEVSDNVYLTPPMGMDTTIVCASARSRRTRAVAAHVRDSGHSSASPRAPWNGGSPRWRLAGSSASLPHGGGWRSPIALDVLHQVIAEAPDAICAELCWEYNRRVLAAERTTLTSLWRAMRRAGYVNKKGPSGISVGSCPKGELHGAWSGVA